MSVIGRLDEQVNDVLIDPVGKRRRRRDEGEDAHSAPDSTRRDTADEDARRAAHDANNGERLPRANREDSRRGDEQLPVWLL
jgi:hypothetical protein